jgi:hypothetical protein
MGVCVCGVCVCVVCVCVSMGEGRAAIMKPPYETEILKISRKTRVHSGKVSGFI